MRDIFDQRKAKPMLIKEQKPSFDSEDFLYEIKFDGIRCMAYLSDEVDLRNKHNVNITAYYPELSEINKQVKGKCILDGEVVVFIDGKPNFNRVQRRTTMRDSFKMDLSAKKFPVCFVAFDILYYEDRDLLNIPLIERKIMLQNIVNENSRLIVSRYIENYGKQFFSLVKEQKLEGIVAKKKDSNYLMGKRTDVWIKSKVYNSIDAVVCGYIHKKNSMTSIIIGQYRDSNLVYRGHVTLGSGLRKLNKHGYKLIGESPFGYVPRGNEEAIWIQPNIVCIIEFMPSDNRAMRLPIFKGIRDDKNPLECQVE